MNLVRLLLILILGLILWSFFKRWLHSHADEEESESSVSQEKPQPTLKEGGKMLRCEHCEVHFPAGDAVHFQGKVFCSEAHRRLNQSD